ncbi:MAG TPA: RNB domain-containing ribonuclease, partial [Microthrixaceae bacterium]|nr:RNB domain-containing ribonuclease [Microthrixaceae bacterium]
MRDEASPDERIRRGLRELREELALPREFPDEVLAAAELAARAGGLAGDTAAGRRRRDLTGIDFVTIDPPGSTDLDQAVHIERRGQGFRVRYAIADVAAFVGVGGPLDDECRARGVTIYLPDGRIP